MKNLFLLMVLTMGIYSCAQPSGREIVKPKKEQLNATATAYFASGCFWCVEAVFESVKGVEEAYSGYAGGTEKNPTYRQVSYGKTSHAEAVKVVYDPSVVSFKTLVDVFFNSHDPSTLNRQGPDKGSQYRSIAFYQSEKEKQVIDLAIKKLLKSGAYKTVTTEVKAFDKFYMAEDYHQDYKRLHPNDSYVRAVSNPRLNAFKKKMPEVLK